MTAAHSTRPLTALCLFQQRDHLCVAALARTIERRAALPVGDGAIRAGGNERARSSNMARTAIAQDHHLE